MGWPLCPQTLDPFSFSGVMLVFTLAPIESRVVWKERARAVELPCGYIVLARS